MKFQKQSSLSGKTKWGDCMLARRARPKIFFKGKDISEFVESFTYTDNTDFTDDVSIVISDRDRFWSNNFFPETGDYIIAEIWLKHWNKENDNRTIKLGTFEIDNLSYNVTKLTINAVAIPIFSSIRDEKKYKTREKIKLSEIAKEIAKTGGLNLVYESDIDPKYESEEQQNEADLYYLEKLCKDEGLAIKITGKQLIIFSEEKYDSLPSVLTLEVSKDFFYGYPTFNRNAKNIYGACEIKFFDSKTDKTYTGTFKAPNMSKNQKTLKLQEKFNSSTDKDINYNRKAKAKLREQNKNEYTVSIKVKGDIIYFAGTNITLKGFYKFDGKYNITTCSHSISRSGYVVDLNCRRCLEGY